MTAADPRASATAGRASRRAPDRRIEAGGRIAGALAGCAVWYGIRARNDRVFSSSVRA